MMGTADPGTFAEAIGEAEGGSVTKKDCIFIYFFRSDIPIVMKVRMR